MNYKENYKRRLTRNADAPEGENPTLRHKQITQTKRVQFRNFYDSPTLRKVLYNGEEEHVIRSDRYKDIELQLYLFEPDKDVKIGSVIEDGKYTYLATAKNGEEIFPELVTKLCNDTFEIPMGYERIEIKDRFGSIRIEEVPLDPVTVPAVISDKDYSTSGNSIISLPTGRINIEIPYHDAYTEHFKVNHRFEHTIGEYMVTDVRVVNITPHEKYIKISATRVVDSQ